MRHQIKRNLIYAIIGILVVLLPISFANATSVPWERTTAPARSDSYYYDDGMNPFPAKGQNCTWYAWGRAYEVLGVRPTCLCLNDAKYWYDSFSYDKGSTPRAGAIACWNFGELGHVSFVEWTDGYSMRVSNSAYGAYEFLVENKTIDSIRKETGFQGYIYLLHDVNYNANGASCMIQSDR